MNELQTSKHSLVVKDWLVCAAALYKYHEKLAMQLADENHSVLQYKEEKRTE
mgnify:CR=1 FL=1